MKTRILFLLLPLAALVGACGGASIRPTTAPATLVVAMAAEPTTPPKADPTATVAPLPSPEATPAETPTAAPAPTAEPEPTALPAPTDWAEFESRTADGFYVRGNPDAPILILDYSDFL